MVCTKTLRSSPTLPLFKHKPTVSLFFRMLFETLAISLNSQQKSLFSYASILLLNLPQKAVPLHHKVLVVQSIIEHL